MSTVQGRASAIVSRRSFLSTGGAIAAAAAMGTLSGCGGGSGSGAGSTTLTMWNQPTFSDGVAEKRFWADIVRRYKRENASVDLQVQWIPWDQAFAKATAAVKAGNPPDFTQTGSEQAVTFAAQGYVEPIDDVVADFSEESWGAPLKYYQYDGATYGATYLNGCYVFYYRKDLFEKVGLSDAPTTWDEWLAAAQRVQSDGEDVFGLGVDYSAGGSTQQLFTGFMAAAGGVMLDAEGKVSVDSPENLAAMTFYTDLQKKKVLPPNLTALTQYATTETPLDQWYGEGRLASAFRWAIQAPTFKADFPETWARTGVTPLPVGPSGRSGAFMAANPFWIFKQSRNKSAAKDFLRWFQNDDIQAELSEISGWLPARTDVETANDQEEWFTTCQTAMQTAVRTGWDFGAEKHNGDAENAFYMGAAVQDVVLKDRSPQEAIASLQAKYAKVYEQ